MELGRWPEQVRPYTTNRRHTLLRLTYPGSSRRAGYGRIGYDGLTWERLGYPATFRRHLAQVEQTSNERSRYTYCPLRASKSSI